MVIEEIRARLDASAGKIGQPYIDFLAHARADVRDLLAEVERLSGELAKWEEWSDLVNHRDSDFRAQQLQARVEALQDWCDAVNTPSGGDR